MRSADSADYTDWVVEALSFRNTAPLRLPPEEAWPAILYWTDRQALTLQLFQRLESYPLPAGVRAALDERREKNRRRLARLRDQASWILAILQAQGLRPAILKGFTLEPHFTDSALLRQQYDLDLYLPPEEAGRAFVLLRERGYETLPEEDDGPASHLPTLIRKTGWEFRGDLFDPEMPAGIEIHSRLWNPEFERMPVEYSVEGLTGQLAGVVLHLMKHLFRGSLRLSHLYELAWFLEHHVEERTFWETWSAEAHPSLQHVSQPAFALAARVFQARLPGVQLPAAVEAWIRRFGHTVVRQDRSGKCEVLLQMALIGNRADRLAVLRRRLFPTRLPARVDAVFLPPQEMTVGRRLLAAARQACFVALRAWYHLRSLPGFARAWVLWRWDCRGNSR